jgi:hypothetical protein
MFNSAYAANKEAQQSSFPKFHEISCSGTKFRYKKTKSVVSKMFNSAYPANKEAQQSSLPKFHEISYSDTKFR